MAVVRWTRSGARTGLPATPLRALVIPVAMKALISGHQVSTRGRLFFDDPRR
jgi:hypothetical protein